MDESIVVVTIISGLFGILGLELMTHNWFKKERFKLESYNLKKQNELQLKKMAKELGLDYKTKTTQDHQEKGSSNPLLSAVLPKLIENLPPETLTELADRFLGGSGESESPPSSDIGSIIEDLVINHPDLVKGFLEGIRGGSSGSQERKNEIIGQV